MIAGRYKLEREVGRGGMGAVWLGRDEVLGREVALKRVGSTAGGEGPDLARAEREARLAASLNHPHVVAVFDLVSDGDENWLVMEYVDGRTLAQLVKQQGALSPDEAAPLLRQAAEALASAHEAGIVHRDVKPSNIMVTPAGQVKLTDFGIARNTGDATLTQTGMVTGSPAYLSPEVAMGRSATDRSDVWGLGATLFHALSGRPPYEVGDNLMGALYRIVHEDPPRLADAGWLAPVLEATMTTEPEDRWTMRRVARFLAAGPGADDAGGATQVMPAAAAPAADDDRTAAPVPPPAPPDGPTRPTGRRRRTGPVLLGAAAAVAVAVLLALVVVTSGDGDDERDRAGATSSPEPTPTDEGSATASRSPSASPSPTEAQGTPPAERAAAMESFVEDYLGTVTVDPATTWRRLTPQFQAASGGFEGYTSWWGGIATADVQEVDADPASNTVTYTVDYTRQDGSSITDTVTLRLQPKGDGFLIAGES